MIISHVRAADVRERRSHPHQGCGVDILQLDRTGAQRDNGVIALLADVHIGEAGRAAADDNDIVARRKVADDVLTLMGRPS